jgi:hypothetical protein
MHVLEIWGTDGTWTITDITQVRFEKVVLKNSKNCGKWYSRAGSCVQNVGEVKYYIGQHGVFIRLCGWERIKR